MICHGRGNEGGDFHGGCCWVNGSICTNRWYIDYSTSVPDGDVGTATIMDHQGSSLGTVFDYVDGLMPGGGPQKAARVQRVLDQVAGTIYTCSIAAYLIGMDPSLINDRAQFDAQWEADSAYQPVADAWEAMGKPRNWCMLYGPDEGQCCFRDAGENDSGRAFISADAIAVRSKAHGAS